MVAPVPDWHPIWVNESDISHETSFWLTQTESLDIIAQARAELADGQGLTEAQIRSEFGAHDSWRERLQARGSDRIEPQ